MAPNPHISAKASDSGLRAALHPLALLTISDYITKHTLRRLQQPIAGGLLGAATGRDVTIEHAFDLQLQQDGAQSQWKLQDQFFQTRLQSYKDVLTKPPLDLVGWWTVGPAAPGPSDEAMALHRHVLQTYNEGALLLVFHPEGVGEKRDEKAPGVRLPLTIYESVLEQSKEDGDMDVEEEGGGGGGEKLAVRLRELPYDVATGEAEMISVDHVARGAANASAQAPTKTAAPATNGAGASKDAAASPPSKQGESSLTVEEEEMLSFLTARANAIRMLQSRIALLKARLQQLPPSYLTDASLPPRAADRLPHQLLRATLALAARLALVSASNPAALSAEQDAQQADAAIVGLLSALGRATQQAKELGGKVALRERAGAAGAGGGRYGDEELGEIQIAGQAGGPMEL